MTQRRGPSRSSARTIAEWVDVVIQGGDEASPAWRDLTAALAARHLRVATALSRHLDGEERINVLAQLLFVVARAGLRGAHSRRSLFDQAQGMGVHLLPVHPGSPIPNTRKLGADVWKRRWDEIPGFDWRVDAQLARLERFRRWADELSDVPVEAPAEESRYYFNNGVFGALDAFAYYCMIREYRPATVVEVGAGFSTMLAAQAAVRNGTTRVRAIEPYPSPALRRGFPGLTSLARKGVQEVPGEVFESLQANDILFIDSTHICKIDSDVNYLMLRVLPSLQPGVFVHFHDIHLPWDYHQGLVRLHKRFWNEQYLLQAFLLFNEAFHVIWSSCYLGHFEHDALKGAFPISPKLMGSSLWLEKIR